MTAKNIILFISDLSLQQLYATRIQKYLQPESVEGNFYAETAEAFQEITDNSSGTWDLLLVDSRSLNDNLQLLNGFVGSNPNVTVGVLRMPGVDIANSTMGILLDCPNDIDEWLAMMNRLLSATTGKN